MHLPAEAYLDPSDARSQCRGLADPYYERLADACKTPADFCHLMARLPDRSSSIIHHTMHTFLSDIFEKDLVEQLQVLRESLVEPDWGYVWPHLKGTDGEKLRTLFTVDAAECPRIFCHLVNHRIIKMSTLVDELPYLVYDAPVLATCLAALYLIMHPDAWWALLKRVLIRPSAGRSPGRSPYADNFHILVIALTKLRSGHVDVVAASHDSWQCKQVCEGYASVDEVYAKALRSFGLL